MQRIKSNKEIIKKLKTKLIVLEQELKNDVSIPVVTSLGFMIALVWRDAIKLTLDHFLSRLGLLEKAYIYNIFSSIIITIILAVLMIFLTKFNRKRKKERIKKNIKLLQTKGFD